METIFDFSAAPHLPYSLRQKATSPLRSEFVLSVLVESSETAQIVVREENGEIRINFADAA